MAGFSYMDKNSIPFPLTIAPKYENGNKELIVRFLTAHNLMPSSSQVKLEGDAIMEFRQTLEAYNNVNLAWMAQTLLGKAPDQDAVQESLDVLQKNKFVADAPK